MIKNERFLKVIILICIINILVSIKFIVDNKYILNVNARNRETVNSILNDNERRYLRKVEVYKHWRHYKIVLHSFLKTENHVILDGDANLGKLSAYVKQNGYESATVGYQLAIISLIIIIITKKYNSKNKL